jgi:NADH-quinone oxidoreductase subunit G
VKKAREGVMEFLLINHPLDCPICDQGGECDLQDQAMAYGVDSSRYVENKRAVEDKYIGPLVKTIMTRCIHCTRCVRFTTEVAGVGDLGATGRGEDMEITTYLEEAMHSELQGNVIDLCPVGALTSRPYAFKARPWELTKTETIDVMDALGSAIRVDSKGREVLRILPRLNESINEEWISDKTRFVWDGLKTQRLDRPYLRQNGRLSPVSWSEAFDYVAEKVKKTNPDQVAGLVGDLSSVEDVFAFKSFLDGLGVKSRDCRPQGSVLHPDQGRGAYLFNTSVEGVDEADCVLLVGTNPREEATILNARLRKLWRLTNVPIGLVGQQVDLTYPYDYLGAGPQSLQALLEGDSGFAEHLSGAKKPLIIVGEHVFSRSDASAIQALLVQLMKKFNVISEGWNGYNVLHHAASRVGALDLGFVPQEGGLATSGILKAVEEGGCQLLFALSVDEIELPRHENSCVVYFGTHGDRGAHRADVILPTAAYTEKSGLYINTEGRVQLAPRAGFPPGDAREDWSVFRALSGFCSQALPFDSLADLREELFKAYPHMAYFDEIAPADAAWLDNVGAFDPSQLMQEPFDNVIEDYYLTNPIARASKVMAECSQLKLNSLAEAAE